MWPYAMLCYAMLESRDAPALGGAASVRVRRREDRRQRRVEEAVEVRLRAGGQPQPDEPLGHDGGEAAVDDGVAKALQQRREGNGT